MSHLPGTKLKAVRSLDDLRGRCVIDEADCWLGPVKEARIYIPPDILNAPAERMTGRMAAYFFAHGRKPGAGRYCYATCSCRCWNPGHIKAWTKAEYGAHIASTGQWHNITSIAKRTRVARARPATKLSMDLAREIRSSDESQTAIAARLGVSQTVISDIRRGKLWKEYGHSVFSQLRAA